MIRKILLLFSVLGLVFFSVTVPAQSPIEKYTADFQRVMKEATRMTKALKYQNSIRAGKMGERLCDKYEDAEYYLEQIERVTARTKGNRQPVCSMRKRLTAARKSSLCGYDDDDISTSCLVKTTPTVVEQNAKSSPKASTDSSSKVTNKTTPKVINSNDAIGQSLILLNLLKNDVNKLVRDAYVTRHFGKRAKKLNNSVNLSYRLLKQQTGRLSDDFLVDYCTDQLAKIRVISSDLLSAVMLSKKNKNHANIAEKAMAAVWIARKVDQLLKCK